MNNLTQVKHFIAGVGFSAAADSEHCPFYERDIHVACVRVYVNAVDFAHSDRSEDGTRVYAKTMDGELVAVDATSPDFRELWTVDMGLGYDHAPCIVAERDSMGVMYRSGATTITLSGVTAGTTFPGPSMLAFLPLFHAQRRRPVRASMQRR